MKIIIVLIFIIYNVNDNSELIRKYLQNYSSAIIDDTYQLTIYPPLKHSEPSPLILSQNLTSKILTV